MPIVFVLEAGEVIHNTFLFQFMFLLFSWDKWFLFSSRKQGKLFITLCCLNPCFCYFVDINDFSLCSGSRETYSSQLAFSLHFSAILLTKKTFVFILKAGEVIRNTLLFQFIFRPFSRHHWLLFLFWKQGKLFITLCYFNPCFSYVLDINDFCFCTGSRGNYS